MCCLIVCYSFWCKFQVLIGLIRPAAWRLLLHFICRKIALEETLIKIFRLYLLVWSWDIEYLITEQNLKCLLLKQMKISGKQITIRAGLWLKNSGPTIFPTNRCPLPLQSSLLNTPSLPTSPELWSSFENTEIEKNVCSKLEDCIKLRRKYRLEQLTTRATC